MLSDEGYNNQLTDTKHRLAAWAEANRAGAHIQIDDDESYWRIISEPYQPSLCPVELVLREDRHYDLSIARAAQEDQPIEDFALFTELFEAIARGAPFVRSYRTTATMQLLATETVVPLPGRDDWRVIQRTTLGERLGLADALIDEQHFASYVLAGNGRGEMN